MGRAWLAQGLALGLVACGGAREPANVLLVTVDTLRADRVGAYGAATARTPVIDRLAAEGVLFENATAPIPTTKPSHLSLFTSRYPRDHGVLNNELSLPEGATTLAQVFEAAGYATAGFVSTVLLDERSGAGRGFRTFDAPRVPWRDAHEVAPRAIAWLGERDAEKPFFLWLHLFDPHMPYAPAAERRPPAPPGLAHDMPVADLASLHRVAARHGGDLPRAAFEWALALYEAEVEGVDHWLGKLREALEASGELDDTVVAFTADHGECFEHGSFFFHSNCLYEAAMRVPLVLRYPPALPAGVRRPEVVENLDVAPTLLALAGLPPPASFAGRDLFATDAERDAHGEYAYLQHPLYSTEVLRHLGRTGLRKVMGQPARPLIGRLEQTALRSREWKLILSGDAVELYHLPTDPGETKDVAAERPEAARELRAALEDWMKRHPLRLVRAEALNDELRGHLEALGYL